MTFRFGRNLVEIDSRSYKSIERYLTSSAWTERAGRVTNLAGHVVLGHMDAIVVHKRQMTSKNPLDNEPVAEHAASAALPAHVEEKCVEMETPAELLATIPAVSSSFLSPPGNGEDKPHLSPSPWLVARSEHTEPSYADIAP